MTVLIAWHGFLGVAQDFDLLQQHLSFPLTTVPLIGHGGFDSDSSIDFSCESQLLYWRDRIPRAAILLGYSMGGRLALQFAARYPTHLKGLILIGATPGIIDEEARRKRRSWDQTMATKLEKGMPSFLEFWNELSIIKTQNQIEKKHREKMQGYRLQQNPEQLALSMLHFGTGTMPSCWERLENVTIPVLLLTGAQDQKYCNIAKQMQKQLLNATHKIITNSGHCCHLEHPEETAREIESWQQGMW